ncbi:MAG: cyclase family protein [Fusobacterium sp. JB019]|nr:cyclase family protein [Fusobacterium sp. JB020]MDP0506156.1 cyclase family protein [Fusobacterium sp. JB019]
MKMKIMDLTHVISGNISVFPGSMLPKIENVSTVQRDGFNESLLTILSHIGTHADAPKHIYSQGKSLDEFSIDSFVGKAFVVDTRSMDPKEDIKIEDINMERFKQADFILFYNGLDKKFGKKEFLTDYPVPSKELIDLINSHNKKGIGFDAIGLDRLENENLDLHKRLFKNNNIINIENLKNLDKIIHEIKDGLFTFIVLPLKFKNSDGAPVRAIGIIEED